MVELPPLLFLPNFLLQQRLMAPMRVLVAGTIMAALMAVEKGWGINIGGGMHHASHNEGEGWCFYADIFLALRRVRKVMFGKMCSPHLSNLDGLMWINSRFIDFLQHDRQ